MITVKFAKTDRQLRAVSDGHSQLNPGNDIVCAAVSTLMYTLLGVVDNLLEGKRRIKIEDGFFDIRYTPKADSDSRVATLLWNMIIIGMLQLQETYPERVKVIGRDT